MTMRRMNVAVNRRGIGGIDSTDHFRERGMRRLTKQGYAVEMAIRWRYVPVHRTGIDVNRGSSETVFHRRDGQC